MCLITLSQFSYNISKHKMGCCQASAVNKSQPQRKPNTQHQSSSNSSNNQGQRNQPARVNTRQLVQESQPSRERREERKQAAVRQGKLHIFYKNAKVQLVFVSFINKRAPWSLEQRLRILVALGTQ